MRGREIPCTWAACILAAGFLVASHSLIPSILLSSYFLVFYPTVMRREEAELRGNYGAAFDEYAKRVPLFFPRLGSVSAAGRRGFPSDSTCTTANTRSPSA